MALTRRGSPMRSSRRRGKRSRRANGATASYASRRGLPPHRRMSHSRSARSPRTAASRHGDAACAPAPAGRAGYRRREYFPLGARPRLPESGGQRADVRCRRKWFARGGCSSALWWVFLECKNQPDIPDAIDLAGRGPIRALSLPYAHIFCTPGGMWHPDLPDALDIGRAKYAHVEFLLGDFLGASRLIADVVAKRADEVNAK